jgi:SHS2 domain-containing protein
MLSGRRFKFLEHRADVYIEAYGESLEEAFENAALATFETMTDTSKVVPMVEETVEAEGFDEESLLYNWLEALLVRFEMTENLYSRFKIAPIQHMGKGLRLEAKVYGEKFNPGRHQSKVGVKAVTYHRMEIEKKPDKVTVKFILDI